MEQGKRVRLGNPEFRPGPDEDRKTEPSNRIPASPAQPALEGMTDAEVVAELEALVGREGAETERKILLFHVRRWFGLGWDCYGPTRIHDGRDNILEALCESSDRDFYVGREHLRVSALGRKE